MSKKLNLTQINALSKKIYDDLNKARNSKIVTADDLENHLDRLPENLLHAGENLLICIKSLKELQEEYVQVCRENSVDFYTSNYATSILNVKNSYRNYLNRNLGFVPSVDTIKQDIILATIDSDNMEDIINSVKSKYESA
jgi:hypothetical protein